jgi:membrane fusion protein (multidrug efflux system)
MSDINPAHKAPKRKITIIIINVLPAICIIGAIIWGISTYFSLDRQAYNNDAQVEEYINPINVRIPGYIKELRFREHKQVRKRDTQVSIDDREYKIAVSQSEAAYLSAIAAKNVSFLSKNTVQSNLSTTDANILASQARLWNAEENFHRYQNLLRDSAATQQQLDQAKTEYEALVNQTKALLKERNTTTLSTSEVSKRINVNDAEIKRAKAALDLADLNLFYTIITAPDDGFTQAAQPLLSFVRNCNKWVVTNYRGTQIAGPHNGQEVKLARADNRMTDLSRLKAGINVEVRLIN